MTVKEDFRKRIEEYDDIEEFDMDEFLSEHLEWPGDSITIDSSNGITIDQEVRDKLGKIDPDYWEWIYNCGKRIHPRIVLWLVGMRLAWEQIDAMIRAPKEQLCLL